MSIITEETKWDASDPESVWIFAESEVQVSDQVLGKGAFGEVRVAKWKNIDVAAKKLYEIEGESHLEAFMQEMRLLSRLRHPNLILFLGVCVNTKTHIPTTILTELMPGSLYNILEDSKVRLQLADILDIALDVATGLDYLHTQFPPIVHRDISAKNILVGGNTAKIADMGQAKVFELSLLSRHSSMPGSMAYCAPEVLTGKYDEKIDIFSFGVLIAHMSTGDYPRIDKREEQRQHAVNTHTVLAKLITECMSFQPAERPSAASICEQLHDIRKNDRHYPPVRRLPPQSDVGVMARRWITEQVETRCKDVKLALEQTTRRLAAEEARWRDEADRADNHVKIIASRDLTISEIKEALLQQVQNTEVADIKLKELEIARDRSESLVKSANTHIAQLLEETEAQCSVLKIKDAELHSLKQQLSHSGKLIDDLSKQLRISKDNEAALSFKDQESLVTIEMQSEQSKELESRLEQAIMRWKKEKELSHSETIRCSKLRSANADLLSKNQRQAFEIEKLTERLDNYDTMSLQEELKARLQDLENDISQQNEIITSLEKEKVSLEDQKAIVEDKNYHLQETIQESIKSVEEATLKVEQREQIIAEQKVKIEELSASLKSLEEVLKTKEAKIADLESSLKEKDSKQLKYSKDSDVNVQSSNEEEAFLHLHHHDGAGSLALMIAHDAFLPSSMETESLSYAAHATAHRGLASDQSRHHKHSSEQVSDHSHNDDSDESFAARRAASLQAVFGSRGATPAPTAIEAREELRDPDMLAKEEVQITTEEFGCRGLIELMRSNITNENESILWRSARAIRDLVHQNESLRYECVSNLGDEITLLVMSHFMQSAVVQAQCIRLLGSLSYGNDIVRIRVGERNGIELIVKAMETHIGDETVQLHATTSLTNFFHNSMDNRLKFINQASGLDILVSVMEKHLKSVNIQRRSCWALLTLVGSDDISNLVMENTRILSAVLTAMLNHRFDPGVQQYGCCVISNLAVAGEDVRRKLKKSGVADICKVALETHSDDPEVVRLAKNALGAIGPTNKAVSGSTAIASVGINNFKKQQAKPTLGSRLG